MLRKIKLSHLFLILLLSTFSFSQNENTSILIENVNATKAGLIHHLNRTGDTIVLTSNKTIYRFTFLFHSEKESVLMDLGAKEAKIPLNLFDVGHYTVVAYREDAVYPIALNRVSYLAIAESEIEVFDKIEEEVLRASLTDAELLKRNIKPKAIDRSAIVSAREDAKRKARREKESRSRNDEDEALRQKKRIKREAEERALRERVLAKLEKERIAKVRKERARKEKEEKEHRDKKDRELAQIEKNRKDYKARDKAKAKREKAARDLALMNKRRDKSGKDSERNSRDLLGGQDSDGKNSRDVAARGSGSNRATRKERKAADRKREYSDVVKQYNLSEINNGYDETQSREEYRKNNLRPNGLPYED